jgi:hypothetical protein
VDATQRIKVRMGNAEFEADGPTELVQQQYEMFMEAVAKASASPLAAASSGVTPAGNSISPAAQNVNGVQGATIPGNSIAVTDDLMTRVFRRDSDSVSLLALPHTEEPEADALMALLLGYQRLLNRPNVTAVTLMQAARQSGINIPRLDTVLGSRTDLVLAAGARRGRRYSLNNRGVAYAEALVRRMVE